MESERNDLILPPDSNERRAMRRKLSIWLLAAVLLIVCGLMALDLFIRQKTRRDQCATNLKQINLLLQMYKSAHKELPWAYVTNEAGKPVLSWRVRAAEYYWYHLKFSEHMDFSQPWNSPKNSKFLDSLHATVFHCPSSDKKDDSPLTDYVAVVGPGTLWPGKEPGKIKSPSAILVVEWPKSDIHWAEPRDITVEEFLDWFRSKPGRWAGNHWGGILYVDASGKVGEIPNDADPETVRKMLIGEQ